MPITIQPVTRELRLSDYNPDLSITGDDGLPKSFWVWVNPPRAMLDEREELRQRSNANYKALQAAGDDQAALKTVALDMAADGRLMSEWYSRLWSKHPDPAMHWSAEDVLVLANSDTDPQLFSWLISESARLIREHRAGAQKKTLTPLSRAPSAASV